MYTINGHKKYFNHFLSVREMFEAHNCKNGKSRRSCQKIYREQAVGLSLSNYTVSNYYFREYVKLRAISWKKYVVNNRLTKVRI